jgi:phage/plasmid-like protein (TIGR03299 family)
MAHELEQFSDGTAAFVGAREPGWHQLGTVTDDALTAADALRLGQLDWTVQKVPVLAQLDDGTTVQVADQYATVRNHPKLGWGALGVVGSRYTPVQNTEVFSMLDAIVDEGGAHYDTAGSLRGGRQVFMTMQLPDHVVFAGGQDKVTPWLLATNSHDGQTSLQLAVVMLRVVCQNTLTWGLRSAPRVFKIRHTSSATAKVQQAREALDLTFAYVDAFQQQVDALMDRSMTDRAFTNLVKRLVPDPKPTDSVRLVNSRKGVQDKLQELWRADTQAPAGKSAWAAVNAVQEYEEWYAPVRGGDDPQQRRAERALTGGGDMTQRVWELVTVK